MFPLLIKKILQPYLLQKFLILMHQISECFLLKISYLFLVNNYITHRFNLATEFVLIKQKIHKVNHSQHQYKQFAFLQQLLDNKANQLMYICFLH